ncbi:hypothetical protein B0O99DRAFT_261524 [Bisporella sp. PMI_857]|nr:hypothetical protein B0O99DRAFT_261524 [Bisporella sp. PMI_857]
MYLSHERRAGGITLPGPAATTTSSSSSSSSTATSSTSTTLPTVFDHTFVAPSSQATSTEGASARAADGDGGKGVNKGAIAGGVIGVVIFLALIGIGFWFCLRTRKQKRRKLDELARDITPMLGSNGTEKFAMDHSPDFPGEERRTGVTGGVFGPFGGYHRTPSAMAAREEEREMDIADDPIEDAPIPNNEKGSLEAPPVEMHPAYHRLPGQSADVPVYYPAGTAHPAQTIQSRMEESAKPYTLRNLPSQRDPHPTSISLPGQVPECSPEIPDLVFSPIDLVQGNEQLDVIPITPQAELAAFPSPPQTIPSSIHRSTITQLRRSMTPPKKTRPMRPRRQSTPPRHSAPLDRLTPPPQSDAVLPTPTNKSVPQKSMTKSGLKISGLLTTTNLSRKPTPRPSGRPRQQTYPSPTAGGRPELPASFPTINTKPMPAFNHISMPSPAASSPDQDLGVRRNESIGTNSTYSIPIGLASTLTRQHSLTNWPLNNHPVTSDAHHLRNQSSGVSALSAIRDLQNASAVSAMSVVPSGSNVAPKIGEVSAHSETAHVLSWQDYANGAHPMSPGQNSEISPMFSPQGAHMGSVVSPMTVSSHTPNVDSGRETKVTGLYGGRTPSQLRGAKTPSQQSLWEREREREEYYGDLSVPPLSLTSRWGEGIRKGMALGSGGKKKRRMTSEELLNGRGSIEYS